MRGKKRGGGEKEGCFILLDKEKKRGERESHLHSNYGGDAKKKGGSPLYGVGKKGEGKTLCRSSDRKREKGCERGCCKGGEKGGKFLFRKEKKRREDLSIFHG